MSDLVPMTAADRSQHALNITDVQLSAGATSLHLRYSKIAQKGRGDLCSDEGICKQELAPHEGNQSLTKIWRLQWGPQFTNNDGSFLTRYQFSKVMRKNLHCCSLDPRKGIHFFRIGAGMSASAGGYVLQQVQTIGCWKLRCYKTYVCTKRQMAGNSKTQYI